MVIGWGGATKSHGSFSRPTQGDASVLAFFSNILLERNVDYQETWLSEGRIIPIQAPKLHLAFQAAVHRLTALTILINSCGLF